MNAITKTGEGGEQHFKDVQNEVMSDEIKKEGVPEDKIYAFIIDNAPLFRFFVTHLPDELAQLYGAADTDEKSRTELEERYENLRAQVKQIFEQRFDADTQTALTDAVENGDITTAERILEANLNAAGRTEE